MYVGGLDFGAFERHLEAESPNPNDPEDFPDIPIVPLGHPEVLDAFYKQLAARAMINGPGNGCDAVEAGENRHDNSPAHDESVHEPGTNETEHEQVFDCFFCENRQFNTAEEREEHEGFSHNYCRRCDRFFLDSSKYETVRLNSINKRIFKLLSNLLFATSTEIHQLTATQPCHARFAARRLPPRLESAIIWRAPPAQSVPISTTTQCTR